MKTKWLIIAGVGVFIAIAAIFGTNVLRGNNDTHPSSEIVPVTRHDIGATVLATGIIKPMVGAEVKVGSRISGVVNRLRSNIGDYVKAGQVLAELDDAELQAKLNQSLAALDKARADFLYARSTLERQRSLLSRALISQQEADLAETSLKVAEAQLKQAEANCDYAKVQLSYATIFSPISGVIASVSTLKGETVSASLASPTFVSIIDLNRLEVQAFVDETDIGKIQVGQDALFTVDTYTDTDFKGKITAIYPKAVIQDNVVNYIVALSITDFQGRTLRPEMTTNVTIRLATRKNVLVVPTDAIVRERGERYVTVLDGGTPTQRKVKAGWKDNGATEIVSGLNEGELILVPTSNQEKTQ